MGVKTDPWLKQNPARIQLLAPICIKYGHPNLQSIDEYLIHFGLVKVGEFKDEENIRTVHYRGFGIQPVSYIAAETEKPIFLGVYFEAATQADFDNAAALSRAGKINNFLDGKEVTVTDPNGVPVHVAYGYTKREFTPREGEISPPNFPAPSDTDRQAKPRRGEFHRKCLTRDAPIPVHKFGHCGYMVLDLDQSCNFYCETFNFKPSDVMLGKDGQPKLIFLHLDLGEDYSDHHTLFLIAPGSIPDLRPGETHHAAFEVESIDTQFIGHDFLASKGYKPFWGVGRHVEGSQVFDYWYDVDGFIIEHYADGDIVNKHHPISFVPDRPYSKGAAWGAPPLKT